MIRTTAVPRPLRVSVALAGVAGMVALAGCGAQTLADDTATEETVVPSTPAAEQSTTAETPAAETVTDSVYLDGTYTADGSYSTPESVETVSVTITLADDIVTAVEVTGDTQTRESVQYQSQFIGGIAEVVVGKNIDELSVSRVAGSSLTSGGFNQAIEAIKAEAAA